MRCCGRSRRARRDPQLAARLGLPYGFASRFAPRSCTRGPVISPSSAPLKQMAESYVIVGDNVVAAVEVVDAARDFAQALPPVDDHRPPGRTGLARRADRGLPDHGHHSLTAWCDNTSESWAFRLRPGNAGSNTALDHIEVLGEAIVQVPARYRRNLLITCDGAGATLDLVQHITKLNTAPGRRVHYSVGFDLDHRARTAIRRLSEIDWDQVLDHRGKPRDPDDAGVAELTGLLRRSVGGDRLATWPTDMRIICRRERPSSGAQLSLMEEADGWRYQLIATNTPTGHAQFLEARHRPHARVEDHIRTGKNTGIGHLPSKSFALNQAWCVAAAIGCDLPCWLRLLCLDGSLARAEPKTLRYRLLHPAARLVRGQRKRKIKIPESWPWARELEACFLSIFALPPPA